MCRITICCSPYVADTKCGDFTRVADCQAVTKQDNMQNLAMLAKHLLNLCLLVVNEHVWCQLIIFYHFPQPGCTLRAYLEGVCNTSRIHQRENPLLNCSRPQKNKGLKCCCSAAWCRVNKKQTIFWPLRLPQLMRFYISFECCFGFEQRHVSSDSFLQLVVWSQQRNCQENTFCQLTAPGAHKQDHLAIISSQSQKGKRMFIRGKKKEKKWTTVKERTKIWQVNRKGWRGKRRRGSYWSPGGVTVYQQREISENIRNFHCRIPCNWVI